MSELEVQTVSQVLPLLIWITIVGQLLMGVALVSKAAKAWEQGFQSDYEMLICGRYLALAANLHAAVTTWRKWECAADNDARVEEEVEDFLQDWRLRYPTLDASRCAAQGPLRIRLRRERNASLDADYPNWVARYE